MATPLTFGNLLKFGLDSCHNAKGRHIPSSTEREREHPKLRAKHAVHHHIFGEGPSNRAPHAQDLSPRRMVEQRPATTATVFSPHSNRGQASTVALVYFKKKVIAVGSFQMHQINCVPLKYSKTNYNAASVDSKPQLISSFKIFITKIQKSPWPHKIYLKKKKSVHTQLITMS